MGDWEYLSTQSQNNLLKYGPKLVKNDCKTADEIIVFYKAWQLAIYLSNASKKSNINSLHSAENTAGKLTEVMSRQIESSYEQILIGSDQVNSGASITCSRSMREIISRTWNINCRSSSELARYSNKSSIPLMWKALQFNNTILEVALFYLKPLQTK